MSQRCRYDRFATDNPKGVEVEDLEDSQDLQEAVLTAYHLMTLGFDHGPATKTIFSDHGRSYVKNWVPPEMAAQHQQDKPKPQGPPRQRPGGRKR